MSKNKKKYKFHNFILPTQPAYSLDDAPIFVSPNKGDEKTLFFSHKYICTKDFCIKKCSYEQIKSLVDKLRILSQLEWNQIASSPRETTGFELIPVKQLKASLPEVFSHLDNVIVFRFGGGNRGGRIVGSLEDDRFYILFIDRAFSLYDHGS